MFKKNVTNLDTKEDIKVFLKYPENTYMKKLALSLIVLTLWSCAKRNFAVSTYDASPDQTADGVVPAPDDNSAESVPSSFKPIALKWEAKVSGSAAWSNYIYKVIKTEEPQMLGQNVADDVEKFCPKYRSLNDDQRLNFWGQLFAGMAYYESGWKPTSWMTETSMSTDPVTGKQVKSEGLLQLSYQDERNYGFDCGFDWAKDKNLSVNDPKKTIFNPYYNLRCGIKIFARQLKNRRMISLKTGVYWSVLRDGGRNKVPEISAITKALPFCK